MKIIAAVCLLLATSIFGADKFPIVPKQMIQATHKLVSYDRKYKENEARIMSYGSAVAINLEPMGLPGKRYLLTAAHCAAEKGKKKYVEIEIRDGRKHSWIQAEVIAFDENDDIAVLKAEEDLPVLAELPTKDEIDIGDPLLAIGCPKGTPPTASLGFLADMIADIPQEYVHQNWWQGSMGIFHGNSGGPVFDANRGCVVGIITAIILGDGTVIAAPNVALFVGYPRIVSFIKENSKKIAKAK